MKVVFADTFYYFAFLNPRDSAHAKVRGVTDQLDVSILTTEWVLTELADGLATGNRHLFVEFFSFLRADEKVRIVTSDATLFERGVELYGARQDKEWSLTDCISFVVMEREGITEALTGDRHFEQAGFRILL